MTRAAPVATYGRAGLLRKVIRISAWDSPNVRRAQLLLRQDPGIGADELQRRSSIVPGVLTWDELQHRLATWDAKRVCCGIEARWYVGAQVMMYPSEWVARANRFADQLEGFRGRRPARAVGIDPAEGGDQTTMAAVDHLGLIELVSKKTPDTSVITGEALAFMKRHGVPPERVAFDRGGGGKQHADLLRAMGHNVVTVGFGDSLSPDPKRRGLVVPMPLRIDQKEDRYAYVKRRAEMYHSLRLLIDPGLNPDGFALPWRGEPYGTLADEMRPVPLLYDQEGRIRMLPKNKKDEDDEDDGETLVGLIGHSCDALDALVLAIFAMQRKPTRTQAGVPS